MNIFVLDQTPYQAAKDHCDKHVVKMIVEYAQMLSTAHRYHDGERTPITLPNGKVKVVNLLPGERAEVAKAWANGKEFLTGRESYKVKVVDPKCYASAHTNHPCSVWARETDANYHWLFQLLEGCLREYTARYGKTHQTEGLKEFLSRAPRNITRGQQTPFALAMPEEFKHEDPVEAYRRFYRGAKARFARWKFTEPPKWFQQHHLER